MSLQRLAVISAIGTHGVLRNRTIYYDRPFNNDTFTPSGISFNQTDSLLVGCVSLSFVIMFMCMMCYCYNKSIDKTSMDVYRRHLMEAANNQNMDIYTVEQYYETEAYDPLCESQSAQSVLPPSYEDVMAAEMDMLKKYERRCTSNTCCEHLHLKRSHPEQIAGDNNNSTNTVEELRVIRTICDKANTDTEPQIAEPTIYDDNGNEMMSSQCSSGRCFGAVSSSGSLSSCRIQNECCCTDNCPIHCVTNEVQSTNPSLNNENNNNNGLSDDLKSSQIQDDNNNINNNNTTTTYNNNPNSQSMGVSASVCQCSHIRHSSDSEAELNILSDNGIIRMDMSKVIDRTGLPTYDAAIKLESFGYV